MNKNDKVFLSLWSLCFKTDTNSQRKKILRDYDQGLLGRLTLDRLVRLRVQEEVTFELKPKGQK
jgi:hypothetical protein